jgi:hypothetical protein
MVIRPSRTKPLPSGVVALSAAQRFYVKHYLNSVMQEDLVLEARQKVVASLSY